MKPSTLLFVAINYLGLASAAAITPDDTLPAIEKRACFDSGASWGSQRGTALTRAQTACNGPLKGTYQKRETRPECYSIGGGKIVRFTVGLTGPNAPEERNLGYAECLDGLTSEIISCGKGGDTTYGRWRYRADPNVGTC
ncbi:uncharacterized protein B0I36DRAFT_316429 [Microdochium trichocladiopsis]|uniref:Secreted protein n=1 Tax=Microdochium trichocladiopsis TaxID=1682393 RepID=A0A9P9BSE4_9PEZI|nr:uncharacterized protein B0I36DRAFT_316429 [Microdochium trichocladiopsis]KAH7034499.1 hypothetical protein B0I36DRAFT_316429 [Microdochium trichocladiopsis]